MQNEQEDLSPFTYKAKNCSINTDGDIKENKCHIFWIHSVDFKSNLLALAHYDKFIEGQEIAQVYF